MDYRWQHFILFSFSLFPEIPTIYIDGITETIILLVYTDGFTDWITFVGKYHRKLPTEKGHR